MKRPAVFLDRDGVLIREVNYLRRPEQVRLISGSGEAVKALRAAGFRVVVITNQSGVARGYFTTEDLARSHARLKRMLAGKGAKLDGLFVCPHGPDDGCPCRKPKPKLILDAARKLGLDLSRSYFVGDSSGDLAAAAAAGVKPVLVRTGKGGRDGKHRAPKPARTARNLASAARWILIDCRP